MNSVALTIPEKTGALTTLEYGRLTDACRAKFDALQLGMRLLPAGHGRRAAFEGIAARLNELGFAISAETLKRFYYGIPNGKSARPGYRTHGEYALVDHRLCGGKCGLAGCNAIRRETLSEETIQEWLRLAERNDKRSMAKAWRDLIGKLMAGDVIPGAGTWRVVYTSLNPGRTVPEQCPYSTHRPPSGWSMSSFMLRTPANFEYAMGKKGLFAAENLLAKIAPVRTDLSNLRFMEVVVFDDHRLDFKAWLNGQIVELWGVFAIDLATRTILAWGVRPRLVGGDDVKQSLTRRDVQHLVAGMLTTHGLPKHYVCTFCVENAAAAITDDFERTLERIMPGRINIERSAVGDGRSRGWREKYGKPRDKRWLESYFNLLEIEAGAAPGQMGNKWENKPGDFDHRLNIGNKMVRLGVMDQLPASVRPFENIEAARYYIHDAIIRCNKRPDHDLESFRLIRFWRLDDNDTWKSCDHPFFLDLPLEKQNALMADRMTGLERKETPEERRQFLYNPDDFESLSPATCFEIYLDQSEVITYQGANCLTFEYAKRIFEFTGTQHRAGIGQKLTVRFDADHPHVGVLMDTQGRVLGVMHQKRSAGYFEKEAIAEQMGVRQKAIGTAMKNVRIRHADPNVAQDYLEAIEILTANLPEPTSKAKSVITPVLTAFAEASQQTQTTAAEDYLQHAEKRTEARALPVLEAADDAEEIEDPGF